MANKNVDEILEKMRNGKATSNNGERIDLNKLRQEDYEQVILDKIQQRGKMTMQDMMMYQMWEDMRASKRQQNTPPAQPQIDVESIIQKATAPFQEEIREMKRQLEKQEQEKKQEAIQRQIDDLKNLILTSKKTTDDDPVVKKLESLENQLTDEKEKAQKMERQNFEDRIENMVADISERMEQARHTGQPKDKIQQIIEIEKEKAELLRSLGIKQEGGKDEQMGVAELADAVIERVPKLAKTASTVREIFSKEDQIPDDVPDDIPTTLPQRNTPVNNHPVIPGDIKTFLNQGKETNGQFIDPTGVGWTDLEGNPLSRKQIEDLALTDPETVRRFIKEAEEDMNKKAQETQQQAQPQQETRREPEARVHTPRSEDITVKHNPQPESTPEPKPEKEPEPEEQDTELPPEVLEYINSGQDQKDDAGNTVWVGKKNEIYTTEENKPATKADLIAEAKKDPQQFLSDVKTHLASLENEEEEDDTEE